MDNNCEHTRRLSVCAERAGVCETHCRDCGVRLGDCMGRDGDWTVEPDAIEPLGITKEMISSIIYSYIGEGDPDVDAMAEELYQTFRGNPECKNLMDDIDVVHIMTENGCVISLNGQGHLPCSEHTLAEEA